MIVNEQTPTGPVVRAQVGGPGWDFAAAHTGLHGGVFEPLHGHTYQVQMTVCGVPDEAGMVADFQLLKEALRAVLAPLKRRTLLAARAPGVKIETEDGQVIVSDGAAVVSLPREWVVLLPVTSTSTESLAQYLGAELAARVRASCPCVQRLDVELTESAECAATASAVLR